MISKYFEKSQRSEAEFLDEIQTKVLRVFLLAIQSRLYTVRKTGLIFRSIERMLKMQFSMARKFTLQPLRRYDVKPLEKTEQA
jgi:hypothetical protein